jgi:hypothetical protein
MYPVWQYSIDHIRLGGVEALEALKLTFHLGSVPLFDWCVSPSSRFVRFSMHYSTLSNPSQQQKGDTSAGTK